MPSFQFGKVTMTEEEAGRERTGVKVNVQVAVANPATVLELAIDAVVIAATAATGGHPCPDALGP